MTIREPVSEEQEVLSPVQDSQELLSGYGSLEQAEDGRDLEAGCGANEANPQEGSREDLPELPYEVRTDRWELLAITLVTAGFVVACTWGVLFEKKPVDSEDTGDMIVVCIWSYLLCPLALFASCRWFVRVDEQGITHRGFRTKNMAWNDMNRILVRFERTPLTTGIHIYIFDHTDRCLAIQHRAKKLEAVFNLISARKRELILVDPRLHTRV